MSMPLAEALEQVELDVGQIYCCQVKGRWVQVRVLESEPPQLTKLFTASDVMMDPWIELPGTTVAHRCRVPPGVHLPFDAPTIPTE